VSCENALLRHGSGHGVGILPLALTPLRFAQGPADSVRMTGMGGVGEDESVEGISLISTNKTFAF